MPSEASPMRWMSCVEPAKNTVKGLIR
jgi:hypothetical protein